MLDRFIAAFVAAAAATCLAAHAEGDCQLKRLASLDMRTGPGGRIEVPAQVAGHPVSLLVDTGSPHSMIANRAAETFGLQQNLFPESRAWMWGGARLTHYVSVDGMQLGHVAIGRSTLFVIPDNYMSSDSDGLLGADVMSYFDADFDFAAAKLNFFSRDHCSGKVVYWTDPGNVAIIPFERSTSQAYWHGVDEKKIFLSVTIDGKEFRAALDTGAGHSAMNLSDAESEFDLKPDSPGMVAMRRLNGTAYRHRFKTMTFGDVTVQNPEIELDPYEVSKMPGTAPTVLVGMSVLRQLHMYVAYQEEKLYVSAASAH